MAAKYPHIYHTQNLNGPTGNTYQIAADVSGLIEQQISPAAAEEFGKAFDAYIERPDASRDGILEWFKEWIDVTYVRE